MKQRPKYSVGIIACTLLLISLGFASWQRFGYHPPRVLTQEELTLLKASLADPASPDRLSNIVYMPVNNQTVPLLLDVIKRDSNNELRYHAVTRLGPVISSNMEARDALISMLADKSESDHLQAAAADVLANSGDDLHALQAMKQYVLDGHAAFLENYLRRYFPGTYEKINTAINQRDQDQYQEAVDKLRVPKSQ